MQKDFINFKFPFNNCISIILANDSVVNVTARLVIDIFCLEKIDSLINQKSLAIYHFLEENRDETLKISEL